MRALSKRLPWQAKIAAKVVLARIPLGYHLWKRVGAFRLGAMELPEYAVRVFKTHFDVVDFPAKSGGFVALELGPGDSLSSGLIARTCGASKTYLVDVGPFASPDVGVYKRLESYLRGLGLQPPILDSCSTLDDVKQACGIEYLTEGLASLGKVPSQSVDFIWSHAVLPHVRRHDFLPTFVELRRIQRPGGVSSHTMAMSDILGGNLNDLRFSSRVWESPFMVKSGFYTNRIRYNELMSIFHQAGFEPQTLDVRRWPSLPTPKSCMAPEFAALSDDELCVSGVDVLLR